MDRLSQVALALASSHSISSRLAIPQSQRSQSRKLNPPGAAARTAETNR